MTQQPEPQPESQPEPIDYVGRKIAVGDTVIYPVRRWSQMWLKRIKVEQIGYDTTGHVLVGHDPDSVKMRRVTVSNIKCCIVEVPRG